MNVISAYMLISSGDATTGGPYTVRFFDDNDNLIQTEADIPQYGTAHCTLLDGTIVGGEYFKGWNPSPVAVTRNLDCYPVRGDYIISHEETFDSWTTICADAGAHYPLGTLKSLVIPEMTDEGVFTDYLGNEHTQRFSTEFQMVKVAEGEDGTTSTWISTGGIYLNPDDYFRSITPSSTTNGYQYATTNGSYGSDLRTMGWKRSDMRHFLNQVFIRNLPTALKNSIQDVIKYSRDRLSDNSTGLNNDMETFDKIWLPSERELKAIVEDVNGSMIYTPAHAGIDYSLIYTGTYGYGFATRDCLWDISHEIKYNTDWTRLDRYWYWGNDASFVIGFCL